MLRFSVLSSGSKANCTYVSDGESDILVDCGLSLRETERRLKLIGVAPENIQAIFLTHEHRDHIAGAANFARKHNVKVFATEGTIIGAKTVWADKASYMKAKRMLEMGGDDFLFAEFGFGIQNFAPCEAIFFGNLFVEPFSVAHIHANDGNRGHQRVGQRVMANDRAAADTLRTCRSNEILPYRFQHRRARGAHDVGHVVGAQRDGR